MSWRTPDDDWQTAAALRETRELHGTADPDRTDGDVLHDDALDLADRLADKAPIAHLALAYRDRPSDRERLQHRQEREARNTLRPRTGHVAVQPRRLPCTCGAADRGMPHPGPAHRYHCPLYAKRIERAA